MEYYYELDQQIVNYYVQMVKDRDALDHGESTQESLKSRVPVWKTWYVLDFS